MRVDEMIRTTHLTVDSIIFLTIDSSILSIIFIR